MGAGDGRSGVTSDLPSSKTSLREIHKLSLKNPYRMKDRGIMISRIEGLTLPTTRQRHPPTIRHLPSRRLLKKIGESLPFFTGQLILHAVGLQTSSISFLLGDCPRSLNSRLSSLRSMEGEKKDLGTLSKSEVV